jgi:hypothetical protein
LLAGALAAGLMNAPALAGPLDEARVKARIPLPAGAYTLRAWHPYQNTALPGTPLQVAGTQNQAINLPVTVPQRKPKPPHDPNQY